MRKVKFKNLIIPILIVIAGIMLTGTMAKTVRNNKITENKTKANFNAIMYSEYLSNDINRGIDATNIIEQVIINNNGNIENFDKLAENLITDYFSSIQIAPNGTVSNIYPLEGNEAGLIDIIDRDDERGISCRYARDNDVVVMQGPFDLLQGGQGIAIRNPIYLDNNGTKEFWGFSIVIVKVPDIFSNLLDNLSNSGYAYVLSKANVTEDDYTVVYSSKENILDDNVTYDFEINDNKWRLQLSPLTGWSDNTNTAMNIGPSVLVFLSIAVAIYFAMSHKDKQQAQRQKLLEENLLRMQEEQRLRHQVQLYATAMGVEYPLAIDMDYLNNTYSMIEYDSFLNKSTDYSGSIDDLVKIGESTIPDEKQAKTFYELFNRENAIKKFKTGENEISYRHLQNGDDGKAHWMETKAICIECNDKTIRGISMSKCIDEQMKNIQLRIDAQRANNAKSRFLLRMSHDIRTPINGVVGMIDIADKFPNDLEKQADCRKKARESAEVLLEIVNEVLDMSKLESGEIVLEHVSFNINDVTRGSYNMIEKQLESKNIEIIKDKYEIEYPQLIGSAVHFKRIVMNILTNAIKYNKDNGKIYLSMIEHKIDDNKVNVEFICKDTGLGMSKEYIEHVFEPFSQENISSRSSYEGTGLGMSIAKSLCEKMGGTISVDSIENVGTTFRVNIPFEIDRTNTSKGEKEDVLPSIEGFTVMVVEDNRINMEIAKFALESKGVKVIECYDGNQAIEAFKNSKPNSIDAILMDVMMPNKNGYEATGEIRHLDRKDSKTIPIIAMSANAFVEDKLASKKAGMNEHLSKPLDGDLLIKTIYKFVKEAKGV